MSRKEAIFYGLSPTKEYIVDDFHADNEYNIEEEESEVTVMEIEDLRNECMRETEEYINRRLLRNHEVVNKECYRKKKSPVWAFFLPFRKVACDDVAIWYYCTLCHFVGPIALQETMKGVIKYTKKNTSSIRNHVLHVHGKKFTRFLSFLELQKNSHLDDASELSTDYGSRKRIKANEVSVGGRLSDYLVPFHPYGDKHPKQKEFEVNIFTFMAHAFTSLSLV